MISVSLVMLTYNRKESVETSLRANLASAGATIDEIIHVDNGSDPGFAQWFKDEFEPEVQILHETNQGVAKGYNRGMLLASSSHIVITGCDRVMPYHWLKHMCLAFEKIENTGVISCYSSPTEAAKTGFTGRFKAEPETVSGVNIRRASPCEARMHSKEFLFRTGLFREDLGLYGMEDCEWVERAERVAKEDGLINYVLPNLNVAHHLSDDDFKSTIPGYTSYKNFKTAQNDEGYKQDLVKRCWELGNPYYNPYTRREEPILFSDSWCPSCRGTGWSGGDPGGYPCICGQIADNGEKK